jgi:hypothetical protein
MSGRCRRNADAVEEKGQVIVGVDFPAAFKEKNGSPRALIPTLDKKLPWAGKDPNRPDQQEVMPPRPNAA